MLALGKVEGCWLEKTSIDVGGRHAHHLLAGVVEAVGSPHGWIGFAGIAGK